MSIRLNRPAKDLDEVYMTLLPEPLRTPEEFQHFYSQEMDEARGGDKVAPMIRGLKQAFGVTHYKIFFIGHPGVGKSTEMYRLSRQVSNKFRIVRFEAPTDLNAVAFQPFDVPLVMMIKLTEAVAQMAEEGVPTGDLPEDLIADIRRWFDTAKYTVTSKSDTGVSASAGIKPSPISDTLSSLLGFFAELKGEIKYNRERKTEVVEYRINTLGSLIDLLNRLLDQANRLLKDSHGQEWLFIGEDFDKPGIPPERIEELFVNNAQIFRDLKTHLIFNIPVALAYSGHQRALPCKHQSIYDAPVYRKDHLTHEEGRDALRTVLNARLSPNLFAKGQQERLIVASGGNLKDLFEMALAASDYAALRKDADGIIGERDMTRAINDKRRDYLRRLGSGPFDDEAIPYEDKAKRLAAIYNQESGNDVPDKVLLSLLRASIVQEFNGEGWFGLHPLIVDILSGDKLLGVKEDGPVLGGTF